MSLDRREVILGEEVEVRKGAGRDGWASGWGVARRMNGSMYSDVGLGAAGVVGDAESLANVTGVVVGLAMRGL